eukprot:6173181-Pleurochrysis_carterae.AAC.1
MRPAQLEWQLDVVKRVKWRKRRVGQYEKSSTACDALGPGRQGRMARVRPAYWAGRDDRAAWQEQADKALPRLAARSRTERLAQRGMR